MNYPSQPTNLFLARRSRNLTQKQLAQNVGCSKSHLCMIEARKRNPSPTLRIKLAQAVDVPTYALLNAAEVPLPDDDPRYVARVRARRAAGEASV